MLANHRRRDERVMDVGGLRFVNIDELNLVSTDGQAKAIEQGGDFGVWAHSLELSIGWEG